MKNFLISNFHGTVYNLFRVINLWPRELRTWLGWEDPECLRFGHKIEHNFLMKRLISEVTEKYIDDVVQ